MKIDRIKFSQEFYHRGLSRWLSFEGSLEGQDPKDAAMEIATVANESVLAIMSNPKLDPIVKPPMDMVILKKYNKAILDKDEKTINDIKAQYHVEN